jgi:hypothetical protein
MVDPAPWAAPGAGPALDAPDVECDETAPAAGEVLLPEAEFDEDPDTLGPSAAALVDATPVLVAPPALCWSAWLTMGFLAAATMACWLRRVPHPANRTAVMPAARTKVALPRRAVSP